MRAWNSRKWKAWTWSSVERIELVLASSSPFDLALGVEKYCSARAGAPSEKVLRRKMGPRIESSSRRGAFELGGLKLSR